MGFVFQFYNLLPVLSAIENVELPMLVSGTGAGEARRRAAEALDMVSLSDRASHRPAELSGCQQQRVVEVRGDTARGGRRSRRLRRAQSRAAQRLSTPRGRAARGAV